MNQMVRPAQFERSTPVEALAGTIERVTFHNEENGFCVLKVQARARRDLVTVVGHAPAIGAGEWITATGAWVSDRVHGLQFKANVLKATPPTGAEGIEKYLASGQMRGIGFRTADAIAAKLGVEKTSPQRLRAGVSFALQTATDDGHCGLPIEMFVTLAERLLEVDAGLIRTAVAEELRRGEDVLTDT